MNKGQLLIATEAANLQLALDRSRPIEFSEHYDLCLRVVDYMLAEAKEAANRAAMSYRHFHVGCAAFAFNQEAPLGEQWKIFFGANVKAENKPGIKQCAEVQAIQAARIAGYNLIIGVALYGPLQPDDDSGVKSNALHPCKAVCQPYFVKLRELQQMTDQTLIVSTGPDSFGTAMIILADLLRMHSTI